MTAFDPNPLNTGLCGDCNCTGFAPKITFTLDPTAKTVVYADASTYPAADSAKVVNIRVFDQTGKKVANTTVSTSGSLSVAGFNLTNLTILATVVSDKGCKADLGIYNVGQQLLTGQLGAAALQGDAEV